MAELPHLGKHCSVESCKQLDFLPFTCHGCLEIFCSDHRSLDSHTCSKEHIQTATGEYEGVKSFECSLPDCSRRELTPIVCAKCDQSFCLSHRHAQDHSCPKLEPVEPGTGTTKTAQHVQQILASKPAVKKRPVRSKASKTAAKVALMKMKMKAQGDQGCPDVERVFLAVCLPLRCNKEPAPMFFSKTWSVGRAIDSIASRLGLQNNNNVSTAQKLRMFSTDDGAILRTDSDLDSFLQEDVLSSGSSVILEYVDNDCDCLEDFSKYMTQASVFSKYKRS